MHKATLHLCFSPESIEWKI